jgi:rhodanese-related sulfurtransferase/DNA-binding transcriptional ArsR family regulator
VEQRQVKDRLFSLWAEVGKAISSPKRFQLLDLIAQGERTVEDLAHETGLTINNTSSHLSVLTAARLIKKRKEAQSVYHQLAGPEVVALMRSVQAVSQSGSHEIQHLAQTYLDGRDELEPLTASELQERLRSGEVTLIDVRPELEYRAGHIKGAVSVPLEKLKARFAAFPRSRPVIAYCRGPYCVFAVDAVGQLRKRGFKSFRLAVGYPDWAAAGLPVEIGGETSPDRVSRSRSVPKSKLRRGAARHTDRC